MVFANDLSRRHFLAMHNDILLKMALLVQCCNAIFFSPLFSSIPFSTNSINGARVQCYLELVVGFDDIAQITKPFLVPFLRGKRQDKWPKPKMTAKIKLYWDPNFCKFCNGSNKSFSDRLTCSYWEHI